jgi:DNA-binding protein HU-beta
VARIGAAAGTPLNRAGLIEAVADQTGLSTREAGRALDAVLGTIQDALSRGRDVRLTGFGAFAVARRKPSTGRNPRTGAAIDIGPSVSVKFRPGRSLKEAVGPESSQSGG